MSELKFSDLNDLISENCGNILSVTSYNSKGKLDQYYCKYAKVEDVLEYIKTRYLEQSKDVSSRSIKIESRTDNTITIVQTTKYPELLSYKNYFVHHKNSAEILSLADKFLADFRRK
jgi:hypothetical protein